MAPKNITVNFKFSEDQKQRIEYIVTKAQKQISAILDSCLPQKPRMPFVKFSKGEGWALNKWWPHYMLTFRFWSYTIRFHFRPMDARLWINAGWLRGDPKRLTITGRLFLT